MIKYYIKYKNFEYDMAGIHWKDWFIKLKLIGNGKRFQRKIVFVPYNLINLGILESIKNLKFCLLNYKSDFMTFKPIKEFVNYRIKLGDVKIECQIVEEKEKNK